MRLYQLALCAALSPCLAASAATITSYTSQSTFAAASSTQLYDNFPGLTNTSFGRTYTDGGITFSVPITSPITSSIYLQNDTTNYHNSVTATNAKYIEALGTPSSTIETLAFAPSSAVGFYLGTRAPAQTLTVTIDGTSYAVTIPSGFGNEAFAGFTSSGTFNTVTISSTSSEIDLLQAYLGIANNPPAVTPEPSSIVLLGTGLLGMAGALRRRLA